MTETISKNSNEIVNTYMTSSWHAPGPREYEIVLASGKIIKWVGPKCPKVGCIYNG